MAIEKKRENRVFGAFDLPQRSSVRRLVGFESISRGSPLKCTNSCSTFVVVAVVVVVVAAVAFVVVVVVK